MRHFDPHLVGWPAQCPHGGEPVVELAMFRRVEPLPGPHRHAVFSVHYECPACGDTHPGLIDQAALDLQPVTSALSFHVDLLTMSDDWKPSLLQERWAASMRRRRWPLNVRCWRHGDTLAGWPSLLRELQPAAGSGDVFDVAYRCPRCDQVEHDQWPRRRLALVPAA